MGLGDYETRRLWRSFERSTSAWPWAVALAGYCEQLADDPVGLHHSHLTEWVMEQREDADREITIGVYVDENLDQFDERSPRLIESGE